MIAIAHCGQCGQDVELDILKPFPDAILCPACKRPAPKGEGTELEVLEAGNDGAVVGVDLKFR